MMMNWFSISNGKTIKEGEGFLVERETLERFGIQLTDDKNNGREVYYSVETGEFILSETERIGILLEIFEDEIEEQINTRKVIEKINLTNNSQIKYNDCIAFQNSYMDINNPKVKHPVLRGYSFGYKTQLEYNNYRFNIQPLLVLNMGEKLMFSIKLLSNKKLQGRIIITLNGELYSHSDIFELEENISSKNIDIVL